MTENVSKPKKRSPAQLENHSFRLPASFLERLDKLVVKRRAELEDQGAEVTRSSLVRGYIAKAFREEFPDDTAEPEAEEKP